uniref:Uncharacterized protein n=1 Tax=Anguilla anguilla TaxID=7936 RepID=A0A0E9XJS8_ANGAN
MKELKKMAWLAILCSFLSIQPTILLYSVLLFFLGVSFLFSWLIYSHAKSHDSIKNIDVQKRGTPAP